MSPPLLFTTLSLSVYYFFFFVPSPNSPSSPSIKLAQVRLPPTNLATSRIDRVKEYNTYTEEQKSISYPLSIDSRFELTDLFNSWRTIGPDTPQFHSSSRSVLEHEQEIRVSQSIDFPKFASLKSSPLLIPTMIEVREYWNHKKSARFLELFVQ